MGIPVTERINNLNHLTTALKVKYDITMGSGSKFCGLNLDWNYNKKYVDIYMPDYVIDALLKLKHPFPSKPQHSPHPWIIKTYGKKSHLTAPDTSAYLHPKHTQHIQRIVGTFLYYARAVDPTIHPALNELAITQAKPTQRTQSSANMLMDYLATHPSARLRYRASDMQLHIDTDAAYLVAPNSKHTCCWILLLKR